MEVEARLLERDEVIEEIGRRLAAAAGGRGGLLVLTGPAGIGRSRLARLAAGFARTRGFTVWEAQGDRLERNVPYGVVRQLLDVPDEDPSESRSEAGPAQGSGSFAGTGDMWACQETGQADGGREHEHGLFYELYRTAVAASLRRPLAVIVDDAHWADAESLRWLHYLTRRTRRRRALTIVCARCDVESAAEPMMATLRSLDRSAVIDLQPLGDASVRVLLADALGGEHHAADTADAPVAAHALADADTADAANDPIADERARLAAACLHSTGGNPFLLSELIGQIRAGTRAWAYPTSPTDFPVSRAVSDAVLTRLCALGPDAVKVARAAVVLGESGRLDQVAELAGVDRATAAAQCGLLRRCGLLEPGGRLRYVHPMVAAAVRRQLPPDALSLMHTRAARLLAAGGAPTVRVAAQLLQTLPAGDRWVVRSLLHAARRAMDAGVPEIAVHYLARAAGELPASPVQTRIRLEWGAAAAMIDPRSAVPQFELAGRLAGTDGARSAAAVGLAGALARCDRLAEADAVLAGAARHVRGGAAGARLRADRLLWSGWWRGLPGPAERCARLAELESDPQYSGDEYVRQLLPLLRAWEATIAGAAAGGTAEVADAALDAAPADGSAWLAEGSSAASGCLLAQVLLCSGRFERARALLSNGLAQLDKHGRHREDRRLVLSMRALAQLRLGDLARAERDAREAWHEAAGADRGAERASWWWASSVLTTVLLVRGETAAAQEIATRAGLGTRPRLGLVLPDPLAVRGRLWLARGRFADAARDLREAGRALDARGCVSPGCDTWETDLALALRTHAPEEAMSVAEDALRRARETGAAWALSRALRTVGVLAPATDGLATLEESVRVLGPGMADLEYASSLLEWGAALRRANRREAAREPLSEALQLAGRCGAAGLVERARHEIAATGARPRRVRATGASALTPSETRVAALAADGLGNPEIARMLLVSRKTVEKHLANVYLKLEISSRRELGAILDPGSPRH